ncbi:MAG TPA: DUF6094 domain-containing protein [Thermoanaerobaculia bacterium]|nr:DUF6094 domain-containing protein [Thermoanaerobaculia bacterium]
MARPESIALGGYFPTPMHLLPSLASLVGFRLPKSKDRHVLVDPCAGDGEAVTVLRDLWFGPARTSRRFGVLDAHVFAVELEKDRYHIARKRLASWDHARGHKWDTVLDSDAFHVDIQPHDGASLLFLNPPYDTDPVHGRLEHRFLQRWTQCLMPGEGVLIFLVPYYALAASASFLACQFSHHRAWRFPDEDFASYKQCVLLARRRASALPDNDVDRARILKWADSPGSLPVLKTLASPVLTVAGEHPGLELERLALDVEGLVQGLRPWDNSPPFGTHRSVHELIGARYEVAMPPRPAHIALALAAGMLNGKRLVPNRPGLPPLLVKGSLRRDFVVVEEKFNKEGELTGSLQVQRPKLTLNVLRLDTLQFHELRPGSLPSGATDLAHFNSADLVAAYGDCLGRLMRDQFPAIHDPGNPSCDLELPALGRRPFTVQRHLIAAGLKLIARGENPIVAAEVGTGKSTVALSIAGCLAPEHFAPTVSQLRRLGFETSRLRPVRRLLIVCPPHLLKSWRDQAAAVLPAHRVQIVKELRDLDTPAEIYVLSRETAKLGHGVVGLGSPPLSPSRLPGGRPGVGNESPASQTRRCPRCGRLVTTDPERLAAKRERCEHKLRLPTNPPARLAEDLAVVLFPSYPFHPQVRLLVANRHLLHRALPEPNEIEEGQIRTPAGPLPAPEKIDSLARAALRLLLAEDGVYLHSTSGVISAFVLLAEAAGSSCKLAREAERLAVDYREQSRRATAAGHGHFSNQVSTPRRLAEELVKLAQLLDDSQPKLQSSSEPSLLQALDALAACGTWEESDPCPEALFQAVPRPRRFPIARYLLKRRRRLAANPDLLILDEAQDYSNPGSAQQKAAHRLVEIPGIPTLALSGSLMGGYAGSLFANFWALSRRFRAAFERTDKQVFITRYGYRKLFVPAGKEGQAEITGYGAQSDREEQREAPEARRQTAQAAGILPLFLLEHLLPVSLIMHKSDLEAELPPCRELPVPIAVAGDDTMGQELLTEHRRLLSTLGRQIRADMYTRQAGRLWGAMSTVPSYLDRCTEDLPPFLLSYPQEMGGALVAEAKLFPSSWLTPKERWVMARVKDCLEEGRNVLLFLLNTGKSGLAQRYLRLLREQLGEHAIFLDVGKVPAAHREDWLNAKVIEPGRRILITNPKAVQTGLNNLVAFSRAIWVQGVDYDARVVRQANGRVHRIGQTLDVTIEVPFYQGTVQKVALDLVARKITASVQVDGLSIEGALESAGACDDDEANQAALGIGQAIYEAWRSA